MGRSSLYTTDLAEEICDRLANGESLIAICRDAHMPTETTVRNWALKDHSGFASKYARAREVQAERFAEEIIDIADSSTNDDWQTAKLRVDTRKWIVSKILPKKYGDRIDHTHHHQTDPAELSDEELAAIVAARKDGAE